MARNVNISAKIDDSLQVHENLGQHAWLILEDKVKLTLIEYQKQFEKDTDWWSPLSILVTIVAAIITTKFEDFWFIPEATIRAMYYMAALYFAYKTVEKVYYAHRKKPMTIDKVIEKLRESSKQQNEDKEVTE